MQVFNYNLFQAGGIFLTVLFAAIFSPATQADDYYNTFFLQHGRFVMPDKSAHESDPEMWRVVDTRLMYPTNGKGVIVETTDGKTTCHVCTLEDFE